MNAFCVHDSAAMGTSVFQDNPDCPAREECVIMAIPQMRQAESGPVNAERQNKACGIEGQDLAFDASVDIYSWFVQYTAEDLCMLYCNRGQCMPWL